MINIDDFVKRLEKILEYYSLSASAFADTVGIQRSGVSHLMSGRNKPSLDFVMKISENFPEVDLYWLLDGKGSFPKAEGTAVNAQPTPALPKPDSNAVKTGAQNAPDLFSTQKETTVHENFSAQFSTAENISAGDIERIVVFYKSGTFKSYTPEN